MPRLYILVTFLPFLVSTNTKMVHLCTTVCITKGFCIHARSNTCQVKINFWVSVFFAPTLLWDFRGDDYNAKNLTFFVAFSQMSSFHWCWHKNGISFYPSCIAVCVNEDLPLKLYTLSTNSYKYRHNNSLNKVSKNNSSLPMRNLLICIVSFS